LVVGSGVEMSERLRLETLISTDGLEPARQWARKTAVVYGDSLNEASHYASQPDWRPLFKKSMQELTHFAETGEIP
jgi:hypothetical protein